MASTSTYYYSTVVGIDFGTGGYAVAIGHKESTWIIDQETVHNGAVKKNSAALLGRAEFNTNRYAEGEIEFHDLGYNALSTFADLRQDERDNFVLFPSAKMALYDVDVGAEALATAVNGATAPAADIIHLALGRIRSQALKYVGSHTDSDVLWVITVPAIWSDAAKQVMRKAAIKAGIPDRHLLLALEPETASISCRSLPGREFNVEPLDAASSYMVVDAGKGTVDITVHQIQHDRLRDVAIPRGGPCGSGIVDNTFLELLNSCFSSEAMDDVKSAMPNEWLEIMDKFEHIKCFGDINSGKNRCLDLGQKFLFHVRNAVDDKEIKVTIPDGITINDRFATLDMSPQVIYKLFEPSLTQVYDLVSQSLADRKVRDTCKTLFLVGGYASCPFLQAIIRQAIDDARLQIEVVKPLEPHLSVVRGAVIFGLHPDVLSARMSQRTIAVAVSVPFDPVAHAGKQWVELDGTRYCTDALDVLVKRGQRIKTSQIIEHVYSPLMSDRHLQNVSVVRIYHSSKDDDIKYIGDEGVRLAGELVVKLPAEIESDQVQVRLNFGSTEVKASASMANGLPVDCSLDFYSYPGGRRRGQDVIQVDICFVMDCTGSMAAYIDAAKEQLVQIGNSVMRQLSSRDEICTLRFAFVGYRDFCDPVQDRLKSIDFTNDFIKVKEFISQQEAFGGGDG